MIVAYGFWAFVFRKGIDSRLNIQSGDIMQIFPGKRRGELLQDVFVSPKRTGRQDVPLRLNIFLRSILESQRAALFLYRVQFFSQGFNNFLLSRLVIKDYSVSGALVHLPDAVGAGRKFFNLHNIILLLGIKIEASQNFSSACRLPTGMIYCNSERTADSRVGCCLKPFGGGTPGGFPF